MILLWFEVASTDDSSPHCRDCIDDIDIAWLDCLPGLLKRKPIMTAVLLDPSLPLAWIRPPTGPGPSSPYLES